MAASHYAVRCRCTAAAANLKSSVSPPPPPPEITLMINHDSGVGERQTVLRHARHDNAVAGQDKAGQTDS